MLQTFPIVKHASTCYARARESWSHSGEPPRLPQNELFRTQLSTVTIFQLKCTGLWVMGLCESLLCAPAMKLHVMPNAAHHDHAVPQRRILLAQADTAFSQIVPDLGALAAAVNIGDARRAFIAPCELALSPAGSVRLNIRTCLSHYTFPLEVPAVQPAFMYDLIHSEEGIPVAQLQSHLTHAPTSAVGAGVGMHTGIQPSTSSTAHLGPQAGFPFAPQALSQAPSMQPVVAPPAPPVAPGHTHSQLPPMQGLVADSEHVAHMLRESSAGVASDHGSTTSFPFSMVNMKAKSWVGFEDTVAAETAAGPGAPQHNGWGRTAVHGGMNRQLSADAALGQYAPSAWDDFVIHSTPSKPVEGGDQGVAKASEPSHMGLPQTGLGTGTSSSNSGFMTAQQEEAHASVDDLLGESDAGDFDISGFVIPSGHGTATDRVSSFGHDSFVSAGHDDLSLGRRGSGAQHSRMERSGTNQSGVSDHADVVHVPGVTQDSAWPVPSGRAFHSSFS